MRVILIEDVANVGSMGDIVRVKDGFGRNYLIPQGLAVLATADKTKAFEHQKKVVAHKKAKLHQEALELLEKLNVANVTLARSVGEDDRLYGSVTNRDIQEALQEQGFVVNKRKVMLDRHIHELGVYKVKVKLASDVVAFVKVWVVAA